MKYALPNRTSLRYASLTALNKAVIKTVSLFVLKPSSSQWKFCVGKFQLTVLVSRRNYSSFCGAFMFQLRCKRVSGKLDILYVCCVGFFRSVIM